MPSLLDYAFGVLFAIVLVALEDLVFWPRFRAAVTAGVRDARRRAYRRVVIGQWLVVAAATVLCLGEHRSWNDLRLSAPPGWRLVASVTIVGFVGALVALQLRTVLRLPPAQRTALGPRLGKLAFLLPRTETEYRWFTALSVTAGACEEFLYRGFLLWLLQFGLGVYGAAAASVVLFGAGHAYQGAASGLKATAMGAVLTGIVLLTGWLVPAMIVHALVDFSAGTIGRAVFGAEAEAAA